jgi:hypothetical protein
VRISSRYLDRPELLLFDSEEPERLLELRLLLGVLPLLSLPDARPVLGVLELEEALEDDPEDLLGVLLLLDRPPPYEGVDEELLFDGRLGAAGDDGRLGWEGRFALLAGGR